MNDDVVHVADGMSDPAERGDRDHREIIVSKGDVAHFRGRPWR
jgi:hypothetical protein